MQISALQSFAQNIQSLTDTWGINFQSVHFLLFLPAAVLGYFIVPQKFRPLWLLLASYYFYFFAAPLYLPLLICATLFTYIFGRLIATAKNSSSARALLAISLITNILLLVFFKYNKPMFGWIMQPLHSAMGLKYDVSAFSVAAAVGISYYTFTSIGYLVDVYRKDTKTEKNIINFAVFLGFFPAISAGPISRASFLLPQIKDTSRKFNQNTAANALVTMAIGFFKKLAVADFIAIYTSAIYSTADNLQSYSGLSLTLAAVMYMLQLYFDFSGYCDIGIGAAGLLGIKLPQNFNTPYFSTNFSSFWTRWHMSLSTWLQDYIFMPLVWSRWTEKLPVVGKKFSKPPMLTSIAAVFLISGIWHGNTLCFVLWGALQAIFRIGEELLHRGIGKPKKRLPLYQRIGKTALVLFLWTESLVFFSVGFMKDGSILLAANTLVRQFSGISLSQTTNDLFAAFLPRLLNKSVLVFLLIAVMVVFILIALWADWAQCFKLKGTSLASGIMHLHAVPRWLIYFLLVLGCFAAFLVQNGGFDGGNFIYNLF